MNKELEFIKKTVIMACHSECGSYEEALKKELGLGCKIEAKIGGMSYIIYGKDNFTRKYLAVSKDDLGSYSYEVINSYLPDKHSKIIGQPLTLDKILKAIIQGERSLASSASDLKLIFHLIYDWDYDQSTVQEQTKEIHNLIAKLLGYENE